MIIDSKKTIEGNSLRFWYLQESKEMEESWEDDKNEYFAGLLDCRT